MCDSVMMGLPERGLSPQVSNSIRGCACVAGNLGEPTAWNQFRSMVARQALNAVHETAREWSAPPSDRRPGLLVEVKQSSEVDLLRNLDRVIHFQCRDSGRCSRSSNVQAGARRRVDFRCDGKSGPPSCAATSRYRTWPGRVRCWRPTHDRRAIETPFVDGAGRVGDRAVERSAAEGFDAGFSFRRRSTCQALADSQLTGR
jgi:hypothetical protein